MNISILAIGTRGDVQPALALGKVLKASGHSVRLLASTHFKSWIEQHGLEAVETRVDIQAAMESEGGQEWMESGHKPLVQARVIKKLANRIGPDVVRDSWHACQGAQVVISSFTSDIYAASIAEKLNARHISMPLQPSLVATRSGAATMSAPVPNGNSLFNVLFSKLFIEPASWNWYGEITNRMRQEILGLPPETRQQNKAALARMLVLHAYSPQVVPQPADWPSNFHTTGYWFLDESDHWEPPTALTDFLKAGQPPICIGFGSMTGRDPQGMTRLVMEAVEQSGQRAIILSGWAGLGDVPLPAHVFNLNAAPHGWLFPRMAAVVHHGGAGTSAAAFRAGIPQIMVPHIADQFFWGRRAADLGVAPPAIPRHKLSAASLAEAIRTAVTTASMKQEAQNLAAKIQAEDGLRTAMGLIQPFITAH